MDLGLAGKRALVTGGASGLGAALTRILAEEGASVAVNYRSRATEATTLAEELTGITPTTRVVAIHADLASREDVRSLFDASIQEFGGLDILVNSAGIWVDSVIGEITDDVWDRTMDVNLRAPTMLSQWLVNHCRDSGHSGRILNITSQAAFRGSSTGHLPYATTKGGMVSMTRSMARELGNCGVTVNCLAIGTMESPMIAKALETRREFYEKRIPIGHIASTREVADVAAFLVSERAAYMTGATVDVSGGQLMH